MIGSENKPFRIKPWCKQSEKGQSDRDFRKGYVGIKNENFILKKNERTSAYRIMHNENIGLKNDHAQ